jgi:hypothetical protein
MKTKPKYVVLIIEAESYKSFCENTLYAIESLPEGYAITNYPSLSGTPANVYTGLLIAKKLNFFQILFGF